MTTAKKTAPAKKKQAKKTIVKRTIPKKTAAKKTAGKKLITKKITAKKPSTTSCKKKTVTKNRVGKAKKTTLRSAQKTKKPVSQIKKTSVQKIPKKSPKMQPTLQKEALKTVTPVIKVAEDVLFNIGDYAVYPAHGVGKIEALESKTIMGEKMDFLVINIIDTGMKVLVPVKNVANVGLRPVIKSSKVKEVFEVLKNRKRTVTSSTWNRRYREYMEKIKSGSIFEIAEVLRDLLVLKTTKELSFGERKMLDTARNLLVKELAVAREVDEKKVEAEVHRMFFEAKAL